MNKKNLTWIFLLCIEINTAYAENSLTDNERVKLDNLSQCFSNTQIEQQCEKQLEISGTPAMLYDFGVHYINGDDVQQDIPKGRYWVHKAARLNYPLAQYNLGVMYYDGIGGELNRYCTEIWLNKAVQQNDIEVQSMAQQALSAVESNQQHAKIYRYPTFQECDYLPELTSNYQEDSIVQITEEKTAIITPYADIFWQWSANALRYLQHWLHIDKPLPIENSVIAPELEHDNIVDSLSVEIFEKNPKEKIEDDIKDDKIKNEDIIEKTPEIESEISISSTVENVELLPITPAPIMEKPPITIKPKNTNINNEWNLGGHPQSASALHFTLQLASAAQKDGLLESAKRHKLTNYWIYETQRNGRQWYVLVYGEFATTSSAKKAINNLPKEFKQNNPWVRKLSQVQSDVVM
ncbi:SPOR domain-containing protein [Proteus myxofaciens]|uniref:Inner membrane bile resistance protein n=1 Tax=Proteus myxofaciens ATCC 19692 TaxID=1354337 RepID=A0A198GCG7_9GAMM|nr:SPOR domain-containing protein [Proteus myxofaciens]OAT34605.1 inner membrane bile resistance protein [Proteus myxofaciens ATCC 19692]